MSVYNSEKYLHAALDSILAQTFTDFEFIIFDDGSSDSTPGILDSYSDPRIILHRTKKNIGIASQLNKGIALARGEYIARMDADDISLPNRLAVQLDYLDSHPSICVVGSGYQKIDSVGKPISFAVFLPEDPWLIKWLLLFHNTLCHPSVMFRKGVISNSGGYDLKMIPAEDYDLWQRLSERSLLSNLGQVLLLYRKHENNISKRKFEVQQDLAIQISQRALSNLLGRPVSKDNLRGFYSLPTTDPIRSLNLIMEALVAFEKSNLLNTLQRKLIHQEAADHIYKIAKPGWKEPAHRRFIFRAIVMKPALVEDLLYSILKCLKSFVRRK